MRITYLIARPWPRVLVFNLLALVGCNGVSSTLNGFVPGKIIDRDSNAEIREAALEDDSFPSASESLHQKK
tara:strand:- start:380 stop:592 length:213 start_codon:yes stop_codon:yes gene_type:complete